MICMLNASPKTVSTKTIVEQMFGHLVADVDRPTTSELDACIIYALDRGWEAWHNAFKTWKEMGYIPFEEVNEVNEVPKS